MMSDTIQARILNILLDKYERSSFFRDDRPPTRRIILKFYDGGESDFSYYDIEQSERRISVNRAVIDLSEKSVLSFEWMKGEFEHIIAKIWLNIDNLSLAYQIAERNPKSDTFDKICIEIANSKKQVKSLWASKFLQDMYDAIRYKRTLVNAIPNDDIERESLLRAISAIDKLDGVEYMERVFSLQTFGDSKQFEKTIKSRLLSILRKYLDVDDDAIDEDILKQVGIVKYPEQFEFCGNISITFDSDIVDFSCLSSGSTVFSSDLSSGHFIINPSIKSIITIENRANYIEYIHKTKSKTELVVYHGGQYSPRKRMFLRAVASSLPKNCSWYHWSDIDYGGFIMLLRLRQEIMPNVIPYRMDIVELKRYHNFSVGIQTSYAEKLKKLKIHPELSDCYDCIDYMLNNRLRLEQEAMLTDS
jgi:hypothetical protein